MPLSKTVPKFFTATGFSFVVAILLAIAVAAYSLHSIQKFQEAEIWIDHTQGVMQKLEETLSMVKDLVGGARSYALTGKPEYFQTYIKARDALPSMLTTIREMVADNPDQLRREAALSTLITQRIDMAQIQIENKTSNPVDIFTFGQSVTNQIRAGFIEMKAVESDLLTQRSRESKARALWTQLTVVGGNLLSFAILVSVFIRLRKETHRRHIAQLQAQKSARESEDLYNLAPCGYHSIDSTGTFIKINDTGLQWFGYTRDELIGKMKTSDLMTPESRLLFEEETFPKFIQEGSIATEVHFIRKDGSSFIASVNASAVRGPNNEFLMSRTILSDISERKSAELKIEHLNDTLRERATQLELANKELEGFSYSVSHDLRAPLRVIGGYALMLEEDYANALDTEGKRFLNVIRANARKMDALIIDLLKLAKSTLTPLSISRIDMKQMVTQIIHDLEVGNGKIDVTIENLHNVRANATLIQQVWENLLTNAAKFSSQNAHPAIRISSEMSSQEISYCVQDNGVGFDLQQTSKLFEVFQRFHTQEQFPGTGVGLALVKRIVTRHGGRVWAQSEPGAGARFYFSLPNTCSEVVVHSDNALFEQVPS